MLLSVENVTFRYPKASNDALRGVGFSVNAGDFAVLCGLSGCGKSTLLRLIKRELAPFGDLSGLFRKRKSVNLFARRLERLIAGEDVFCIVTACSDTLPAELPPAILRAFVPFYLAPPTDRQRQQYFHALKDKYDKGYLV